MAEWDDEAIDDVDSPEFRAHGAAVLKDWSAQDFANIYTRFRPHLERHARKFLRNPSQVDEVVQDAFLYLMVTLPELDSELGVLRFLKWKVRLLCLDVIRASGRAYINSIDDVAEPESNDPEIGAELEHAEDAAIVRLALSKLNPRHREVLLASMYEEKSTREIAAQVGLSENATLQLIFRARAAFKKALLGADVDTAGMSVSAILSVAARKAAHDAKQVGAQAMVFVLFLALAVGAFVNFGGNGKTTTSTLAESPETSSAPGVTAGPSLSTEVETTTVTNAVAYVAPIEASVADAGVVPNPGPSAVNEAAIAVLTHQGAADALVIRAASKGSGTVFDIESDKGISANITFSSNKEPQIYDVTATLSIGDQDFIAYPKQLGMQINSEDNGDITYTYVGSLDFVVDVNDWMIKSQSLENKALKIFVTIDKQTSEIKSARLEVGSRY